MHRRDFIKRAAVYGASAGWLLEAVRAAAQTRVNAALVAETQAARALVGQMTLAEKIGQMTQAELNSLEPESDIESLFLGSVLSGGGADPVEGNGLRAWTDTVDRLIERSLKTRLGIPILYGADAVHGHSNVLGAVIFPHNIGLGCTRNEALVEQIGRVTAEEVRATGIRWTFAPCVAVPRDERWGRTYEGFSEDPELVHRLGRAAVRGLQRGDLADPLAVLACAKHFIGDGGTAFGSQTRRALLDQGDTRLSLAELERVHLPGYLGALEAGVGSIMVSYSSWNGREVSGQRELLTGLLKDELGFEGFLISDYNAIARVDADFKTAIMTAINAGIDMAMEPNRYRLFIRNLSELVEEGRVAPERIDDAVTRILRVKLALGLMDAARAQTADRSLHASFGSTAHRDVARQAVRESLVLLKNEPARLPIAKDIASIHVAGRGGDDIGMQCGGWTIEWQGERGPVTPGGTTLLAAIRQSAGPDTRVTYSVDGAGAAGASLALVVVGESPYAEGVGDRADLALGEDDRKLVATVAATGAPIVLIVLSGRPLVLDDALEAADAVVAAWLPGTEGQGIADVLFGDFAPTGRLSFTWPRSMAQIPINVGDADYDPLFPYGFGVSF